MFIYLIYKCFLRKPLALTTDWDNAPKGAKRGFREGEEKERQGFTSYCRFARNLAATKGKNSRPQAKGWTIRR